MHEKNKKSRLTFFSKHYGEKKELDKDGKSKKKCVKLFLK